MKRLSKASSRFRLEEATITDVQAAMKSGEITARSLTEMYLDRIAEYNRRGPCINAVLELNPDALRIADSLDRKLARKTICGPLHGVPVLLKDNIGTADRMNTSSGSYLLQGIVVERDATIASRLREAGAVILGKANMDELGMGNGVPSGRGGPVRNPYGLDRNASGSSSGSAAAIAANFAAVAFGTDARSSIRFPASDCSVVALKPTMGLISRAGIMLGVITIDTVGPLTRTVTDLAITLGVITGLDPLDPATNESAQNSHKDYQQFLRKDGLHKARIGVARKGVCGVTEDVDSAFDNAIAAMKDQGAEIIDSVTIEAVPYGGFNEEDGMLIRAIDQKARMDYFEGLAHNSPIRSFEQFSYFALTSSLPTVVDLRWVLKDVSSDDLSKITRNAAELMDAYAFARDRFFGAQRSLILSSMDANQLDAIVYPTKSKLATPLWPDESFPPGGRGMPEIASYSGFPELTLPAGYSRSGLPIGLSFLGRAFSEPTLLRLAYAFEQATRHRRPPDLDQDLPRVGDTLPEIPLNNKFANRLTIGGASGEIEGNNFSADIERGEPRHGTSIYIDRSVWYSWTAPECGVASFDTSDSYPALHCIAVYTGSTLSSLVEVACNNYRSAEDDYAGSIEFKADKGITYHIAVGSHPALVNLGKIVLRWRIA
jgi:amidase